MVIYFIYYLCTSIIGISRIETPVTKGEILYSIYPACRGDIIIIHSGQTTQYFQISTWIYRTVKKINTSYF
jgi:hypothetical protein